MNAPKLRFKSFNSSWEKTTLGEISDVTKLAGFEFTKYVNYSNDGTIIALRGLNIKNGAIDLKDVKFIDNSDFTKLSRSKLFKNDLLFTYVGTIGEAAIVNENDKYYLAPNVCRIRPNESQSSYFLLEYIQRKEFKLKVIDPLVTTSSQPSLSMENVRKFEINLPSIEEQKQLSEFFELFNNKIGLQQGKVDLLKEQKKGYMQKIFNQELRFKDKNGNEFSKWEERDLEQLCDINTGNKDTQDNKEDGLYPFFVRSQIVERIDSYSFDGEAILTAGDGVGVGKVFHYINGKFDYHQRVYMLSGFKNCVGKFVYYYFSQNFMKEAQKYNAKTSVDSVRREMLTKMKFPYPCIEEQKKIADFITRLDCKISIENKKLEQLKQQKQGFMQQMFI